MTLRADEKPVEEETVARIIDQTYGRRDAGLCCGYDTGHPVTNDYEVPFRFTGTIKHVIVELLDPTTEENQRSTQPLAQHEGNPG